MRYSIIYFFVLIMLGFSACEVQEVEQEEPEVFFASKPGLNLVTQQSYELGQRGGRFTLGTFNEPRTFNPVLAEESSSTDITERLQIQLIRRNQFSLEWEPFAAESWEISDDEKTLTLNLRDGLFWSDGTPIRSYDWVDGINKLVFNDQIQNFMKDNFRVADDYARWEALDDHTIQITVPEVYAGLLNMAYMPPFPMHILGPLLEEEGPESINALWGIDSDLTEIPSSGPFLLSQYNPGESILLIRNPLYFEKDEQGVALPYIDELEFVFFENQDSLLQSFMQGDLDYLMLRGEDYSTLISEKQNLGFELYELGPSSSSTVLSFNQNPIEGDGDLGVPEPQHTWLNTLEFRLALSHLINRETIINTVAFGFGYPQYSFVPNFSPYYWEEVSEVYPEYDPERAKELLTDLGFIDRDGDGVREDENNNRLSLELVTNQGNRTKESIAVLFAQEAANIGIEIIFKPIPYNALVERIVETYNWQLAIVGLSRSIDPVSGVNVFPSYGSLHMIEPKQATPRRDWEKEFDANWIRANNTTDQAQRKKAYESLQRIWAEQVPWTYTYNMLVMEAYDTGLSNVVPQPLENYDWEGILPRIYFTSREE